MDLDLKTQEDESDSSVTLSENTNSSNGSQSRESVEGCYCKDCKLCKLHKNRKSGEEIDRLKRRILTYVYINIKDKDIQHEIEDDLNIMQEINYGHWCDCWY